MVNIRYPDRPIGVDASGFERGLSALGEKIGQRRQERRDLAEAEKIFGNMIGGGSASQGADDFNKYSAWANGLGGGGMSLDQLDPRGVIRAPLPAVDSAPVREQAGANVGNGSVFGRFMKAVQGGGLTNGAALAAVAATGNRESGFKQQNADGTWSDPSQSGQPGTAGGIMSWRGDRLTNMQRYAQANGGEVTPEVQAQFFLQENPQLIAQLQAAKTPQEAQQLMNNAWRYAGYDQPGGETAARMAEVERFAPQFAGSQQAPSQQALENMAVGQSVPMPMAGGQAEAGRRSPTLPGSGSVASGFNLDPATMAAAFKNPYTRGLAGELAKTRLAAMADQRDPMKQIAYEKAVAELDQLRNPRPKMTDDMAEYLYSQKDPNFGQYQIDQKRASSTQVNVGSEKGYDKTLGEGYGKRFLDIQDGAQTAQRALNALDVMEQSMSDPGFYSGAGAGAVTNLKRLGRSLGMDVEGISNTETFNAMAKQAALDTMGGSLGSGFSNADRDFVLDQVPNLQNTPEGNAQLIDIQRKVNTRRQQIAKLARDYASENGGRIDAGFDDTLARWSDANPLFPEQPAGSGANRGAGGSNGRSRARNPKTGETVEWDGSKWSPVR